jgi:hypothetical protein
MATVITREHGAKAVKNLGWLLKHWRQVEWLGFNWAPDNKRVIDGELVARLLDGSVYLSEYASLGVCWNWLNRPVFKGLEFRLRRIHDPLDGGRKFTVGDAEWLKVNKLDHKTFQCFVLSDCVTVPANSFYQGVS